MLCKIWSAFIEQFIKVTLPDYHLYKRKITCLIDMRDIFSTPNEVINTYFISKKMEKSFKRYTNFIIQKIEKKDAIISNLTIKGFPNLDVVFSVLATTLAFVLYKKFQRFKNIRDIPSSFFEKQKILFGYVVKVSDGDNFHFYHLSRPRLFHHIPNRKNLKLNKDTINVRLAGIDAPEFGYFGMVSQPYAQEAKTWLTNKLENKYCWIKLHKIDQYSRAVSSVNISKYFFFKENISLSMIRQGLAVVYTSHGAVYGDIEDDLKREQLIAQRKSIGLWKQKNPTLPEEHKRLKRLL